MGDGADLEQLLGAFAALVAEHEAKAPSEEESEEDQNFRCVDCTDCTACRFCTACERCVDCTYCDACNGCEGCTQSRECLGCAKISQSSHSAYCEQSSYLTLCLDCDNCVQCFGCVGLSEAEFHILNKKYRRGEYFKKVNELRAALDAKTLEGWFPPWVDGVATPASPESTIQPPATPRASGPTEPREPTASSQALDEPAPEQTGEVDEPSVVGVGVGVPKVIETASEYTGSWPPEDHASARALDRHRGADEAWSELEAEGSQAFSKAASTDSKARPPTVESEADRGPSKQPDEPRPPAPVAEPSPKPERAAPATEAEAPAARTPDASRFSGPPKPAGSRFGGQPAATPSPTEHKPMGAGLLPDELVGDAAAGGRFDRGLLPPSPSRGGSEGASRTRDSGAPAHGHRSTPPERRDSPSLRSATRPSRPRRPDK